MTIYEIYSIARTILLATMISISTIVMITSKDQKTIIKAGFIAVVFAICLTLK